MPAPLWDTARIELHSELKTLSPKLAGVYHRAIVLLEEFPLEGEELVRVALLGHCLRELMNRLPDVLKDVPGMLRPTKPSSSKLRDELLEILAKSEELNVAVDFVSVPGDIVSALKRFAAAVQAETARGLEKDSVAVTQTRTSNTPAVKQWTDARKFFMDFVHLDSYVSDDGDASRLPSDAEILERLVIVEAALRSRLFGFFQSRRELDRRLAHINEELPGGKVSKFRQPSAEEVREMIASVGPPQLRRAFYQGLNNPLWVSALAQQAAFASPPPPERDDAGYVRDAPWPEIDYLMRMARVVPEDVVNVAVALLPSENAWVRRGIVEIAAKVPADQAARLARSIAQWAPDELGARTDPGDLATATENLLRGGQTKLGVALANALYHPRESAQTGRFRSEPRVAVESYWYGEALPRIVDAFGEDRLMRILPWLEDFEIHAGNVSDESDLSYYGRPRIARSRNGREGVEDALIDAVRDAALERFKREPSDTISRLLRSGQALSKKIALFIAATEISEAIEQGADIAAMVEAVHSFPGVVEFTRHEYLPEFAELLQALSAGAGADALASLSGLLPEGPLGSRAELIERLRADQAPEKLEGEAGEYIARWQHRLLSAIGADSLPVGLRDQLADLDASNGILEDAANPDFEITSWTGPLSPTDSEALNSMGADNLLEHLEQWHPDQAAQRSPSHEGQARELTAHIAERPDALPVDPARLLALRPTYLRSVIRGWADARQHGHDLPWDVVVPVIEGIQGLPDISPFTHEGRDSFDDDKDYRHTKSVALNLIEASLSKAEGVSDTPTDVVARMAPVLIAMSNDPALRVEYEENPPEGFDPLTLSLNRRLPQAVRALTKLATWEGFGGATGDAVDALSGHLREDDPHGAIAAVFGEALSRLYNSALSWLEANVAIIFGIENEVSRQQQISLSTALATQQPHRLLLALLRAPISGVLTRGVSLAVGWKGARTPDQLLGDWIVTTFNTGGIDMDDPLISMFFERSSPETRGDVLGHVGWSLMHATRVDEGVRLRIEELWDWRAAHVRAHRPDQAELADFYWYVRSGKFDVRWWLPRLLEATGLVDRLNTHGMIGEQLADASKIDAATTFEIIRRLTTHEDNADDRFGGYDLLERAVPQALASALDSGDATLVADAAKLMDKLGARGYIDLDSRVQALRVDS